jgi:hypothetical protein
MAYPVVMSVNVTEVVAPHRQIDAHGMQIKPPRCGIQQLLRTFTRAPHAPHVPSRSSVTARL